MRVHALSPVNWALPEVVIQGKAKLHDAVNALGKKLQLPGFKATRTFYEKFSRQGLKVLEFLPDTWNVMSAAKDLVDHYTQYVPSVVRMVVAAFGVLNLPLVPAMVLAAIRSLWAFAHMSASRGFSGLFEGAIRVVYYGAVSTALVATGASGLVDFFQRLHLPTDRLYLVMQAVFPWVACLLRISMIPQVMDISSGMRGNARLAHFLEPLSWKDRLTCVLPIRRIRGNYYGTPVTFLTNLLYGSAVNIMATVREYQRLYRKVDRSDLHFGGTIRTIEGRMNSWILPISWYGSVQAIHLGSRLQKTAIIHGHNQMLGLSGNCFAILGMIARTNIVAFACFAILSSLFFILQTAHRQALLEKD